MDDDFAFMIQDLSSRLGPDIEALLVELGLQLPADLTGAGFIRELMEGTPQMSADPGFVAWLAVRVLGAHPDGPYHPEVEHELRARLAAREGS